MDYETAPLIFDLRWEEDGRQYALAAKCCPGLTVVRGYGASSLLRLLAGRPVPHAGSALLDGRPLRHNREAARHGPETRPVASVLGDEVIAPWRTTLGAVTAAVREHGVPYLGARRRGMRALDWAGVASVAHRPTFTLDAGARERVRLAMALAKVPGLLLLDRAFTALPPRRRGVLWDTIERLAASWETVVLCTSDDAPEAIRSIYVPYLN